MAAAAEAMGKLLDSLKDEPNSIIQVGTILLVKSDGMPVVRQLSQTEPAYSNCHPHLMTQPEQLMKALREGVSAAVEPSAPNQHVLGR